MTHSYPSTVKERLKRNEVVNEVIQTEKTYVQQLETLVNVLINPALEKKIVEKYPVITEMFFQVKNFVTLHQELLKQLESKIASWSPASSVGDVFLQMVYFRP